MLAGEKDAIVAIRARFSDEMRRAAAMHDLAATLVQRIPSGITKPAGVTPLVLQNTVGLLAKAVRQARSAQLLAERGMAENGLIVIRSMFDTQLALLFVIHRSVRLVNEHGHPIGVPAHPRFNTHFRSVLYSSKCLLSRLDPKERLVAIPGMKRMGTTKRADAQKIVAAIENQIGPVWLKRLRSNSTCAGVPVKALARSVMRCVTSATALMYPLTSRIAHANDIEHYVEDDGNPASLGLLKWGAHDKYVGQCMIEAQIGLLLSVDVINGRLGLGLDDQVKAHNESFRAHLTKVRASRRARRRSRSGPPRI